MSNLDHVGVWISKSASPNSSDIVFRLRKAPESKRDIVVIRTPVETLVDNGLHWFTFRPLGDDEHPVYYIHIESPGSTAQNALRVRIDTDPRAGTVGSVLVDGVEKDGVLSITLQTDRSIWTRLGYVLARFEIDKPWFYNRYFFAGLFIVYGSLVVGFLWYTYRLIHTCEELSTHAIRRPVVFILCLTGLFLVRGIFYSSLFPAWQAPDEPSHFDTIRYVSEHRSLPPWDTQIDHRVLQSMDRADYAVIYRGGRPRPDWQTWIEDPRATSMDGKQVLITTAGLPKLSHVVASIPYLAIDDLDVTTQLFLLRLFMVCVSCAIMPVAVWTVGLLFPTHQSLQIFVPSLLCFYSMYVYIASIVSYDVLTNVLAALYIYFLLRILVYEASWRDILLGGGCLGCALLTKAAAVLLVPSIAVLWVLMSWRNPDRWGITYRLGVMTVLAGCIGGWWYFYNIWTYGVAVPGMGVATTTWSRGEMNADLGLTTIKQLGWTREMSLLDGLWATLSAPFTGMVGNFGWSNAPLGPVMYSIALVVLVCACYGGILGIRRVFKRSISQIIEDYKPGIMLGAVILTYSVLLMAQLGRLTQGRYLFPVIVPLFCIFAWGLFNLIPVRYRQIGIWCSILGMVLFDSCVLLETIIPRYYLIPPPSRILAYFL